MIALQYLTLHRDFGTSGIRRSILPANGGHVSKPAGSRGILAPAQSLPRLTATCDQSHCHSTAAIFATTPQGGLWPGALAAAALHQPAHLEGNLGGWAERCRAELPSWSTRARA